MGSKKINLYNMGWATSQGGPFVQGTRAVSGTGIYYSNHQNVQNFDNIYVQLSWTGTVAGNFFASVSADGIIWDDLTLSPTIVQPAGSSGHWSVNVTLTGAPFLQIRFESSSGSGTINANLFSKDVN